MLVVPLRRPICSLSSVENSCWRIKHNLFRQFLLSEICGSNPAVVEARIATAPSSCVFCIACVYMKAQIGLLYPHVHMIGVALYFCLPITELFARRVRPRSGVPSFMVPHAWLLGYTCRLFVRPLDCRVFLIVWVIQISCLWTVYWSTWKTMRDYIPSRV